MISNPYFIHNKTLKKKNQMLKLTKLKRKKWRKAIFITG